MSFFHKAIIRGYKSARLNKDSHRFSIRLHQGGDVIHDLTVDDVLNGERDVSVFKKLADKGGAMGNLTSSGGIHFITKHNKKWFIKFTEFSFVFNHRRKPAPVKPEPAREELKAAA